MIVLDGISKSYNHQVVIDDINLKIKKGERGLLGPNGAGKLPHFE
jgi:ABC-type lipopolysaccharide export system ATPase subunit